MPPLPLPKHTFLPCQKGQDLNQQKCNKKTWIQVSLTILKYRVQNSTLCSTVECRTEGKWAMNVHLHFLLEVLFYPVFLDNCWNSCKVLKWTTRFHLAAKNEANFSKKKCHEIKLSLRLFKWHKILLSTLRPYNIYKLYVVCIFSSFCKSTETLKYSQTSVQRLPLGNPLYGRCRQVVVDQRCVYVTKTQIGTPK